MLNLRIAHCSPNGQPHTNGRQPPTISALLERVRWLEICVDLLARDRNLLSARLAMALSATGATT